MAVSRAKWTYTLVAVPVLLAYGAATSLVGDEFLDEVALGWMNLAAIVVLDLVTFLMYVLGCLLLAALLHLSLLVVEPLCAQRLSERERERERERECCRSRCRLTLHCHMRAHARGHTQVSCGDFFLAVLHFDSDGPHTWSVDCPGRRAVVHRALSGVHCVRCGGGSSSGATPVFTCWRGPRRQQVGACRQRRDRAGHRCYHHIHR